MLISRTIQASGKVFQAGFRAFSHPHLFGDRSTARLDADCALHGHSGRPIYSAASGIVPDVAPVQTGEDYAGRNSH